jgi:hypothetical protein
MRYPQMVNDNASDPKTQRTPKGAEIPIPTRGEFMKNLKKAAKKPPASAPDRPKD